MSQSDKALFEESLKLWDKPQAKRKGPPVLKLSDDVERMVDEMFERFCQMGPEEDQRFVGNC